MGNTAITLDELIALNDEIAALVRAGVPLEQGLAELGSDMPGRLGKVASMLAERAGRGEPLEQVLSEQSAGLPPVYGAVVRAGLEAGRLPAALEAVAGSARRLAETRRSVMAASLYPLLVLMLAWGFFAFFACKLAGPILQGFERLEVTGRGLFGWLARAGPSAAYWGPAVPLALLILAMLWWSRTRRAAVAEPQWAGRLLGWLPWLGRTLRCSRTAAFVEVLALLVENRVPLPEAIELAAEASGDRRLRRAAAHLADALRRGEPLTTADNSYQTRNSPGNGPNRRDPVRAEFPPLLRWLMLAGQRHGALLPALKHAAATYHRRARHHADLARVFLPFVLTIAVGGGVTLLYALTLFVPYVSILKTLGAP
jgi:general secretion pathway protein F